MHNGPPKVLAFYLPQFQPTPENDRWWGKGFTEWTMVSAAKPLFPGHRQPRRPGELGYYDLRLPDTRLAQAELASGHGIDGFCYYHYWSLGRRLLGRVLDDVLASGVPDAPFCLNWCNHPWSRRWDGKTDQLLFDQRYSPDDDLVHIRWLCDVFHDPRYLRVDGRPILLVQWASRLPDVKRTVELWRTEASRLGVGDLYLCSVEQLPADRDVDPRPLGFDAGIRWEPVLGSVGRRLTHDEVGVGAQFAKQFDSNLVTLYDKVVTRSMSTPEPGYPHHPVVLPGWDNWPRRRKPRKAIVLHDAEPLTYRRWLEHAVRSQRWADPGLVFVNAWNEWSEGAYLEPDDDYGRQFLQAHLGLV